MSGKIPPSLHSLGHAAKHHKWDNSTIPELKIRSGEVVTIDCIDGCNGQITRQSPPEDVINIDFEKLNPIFGPIHVEGAEPGDVLEVEVLDIQTGDWGFTVIAPGASLLPDEFKEAYVHIWDLPPTTDTDPYPLIKFKNNIRIPKLPFLGVMGVAPAKPGPHDTIPPFATGEGGNMDCRHMIKGTRVLFPVRVPGALFSCGDGHAAQGDGEVSCTAIETTVKATLRFTVLKDRPSVPGVQFTCLPAPPILPDKGTYYTMGVDADLLEATRKAVRAMVDYLVQTQGLDRHEALILCSVAVDVKVAQLVDYNLGVVASIQLGILG